MTSVTVDVDPTIATTNGLSEVLKAAAVTNCRAIVNRRWGDESGLELALQLGLTPEVHVCSDDTASSLELTFLFTDLSIDTILKLLTPARGIEDVELHPPSWMPSATDTFDCH